MSASTTLLPQLAEILAEVAGTDPAAVVPAANLRTDLDLDSLTLVEIAVAAEERFGVRIPDSAVDELKTVEDVLVLLAASGVPA